MGFLRDPLQLLRRLAARARRARLDDELRDEIAQHIAMRERQLIDAGMNPSDAAYEARRMFGNALAVRERAQHVWSLGAVETLAQDVRFAGRLFSRTPAFTATVVLSLALGIGAAAAVFQFADALLFRPLSVRAAGELWSFRAVQRLGAAEKIVGGVDDVTFARMQAQGAFAQVAGSRAVPEVTVQDPSWSAAVRAEAVSSNYFEVLGLGLATGSFPAHPATATGVVPVMLSERLWRGAFSADAGAIGRLIAVNGRPAVISGVLRGFRGLNVDQPADLFVPLAASAALNYIADAPIRLVLRVGKETSSAEAEQRLAALYQATSDKIIPGAHVVVQLLPAGHGLSAARDRLARPAMLGLTLAFVLLLMASANAGGLLLARLASRRGEFAVRLAIGAGRARLVRQLMVEALLLGVFAAAAGLCAGSVGGPLLAASIPSATPIDYDLRVDGRLLAFTAATSLIAALTAVGASVLRLVRADVSALLASESRTMLPGSRRSTRLLIAAQITCTMLLLVGAAALTRTLLNLRDVPAGFAVHELFAIDIDAGGSANDPAAVTDYLARLLDAVSTAPLVASASLAQFGLMVDGQTTGTIRVSGFNPPSDEDRWVRMYFVGPRYFETVGMPLLLGRDVQASDGAGRERVAVVNERLAKFYFGSASAAIGQLVNENVRIVGIAADAQYDTLRDEPARVMFVPYVQAPPRQRMTVLVRPAGDRTACLRSVQGVLKVFDSRLRPRVTTGETWVSAALARERFLASVALILSVLASCLACAGLYAAVASATAQRKGEIALRMALGASRAGIVSVILDDPLRTTLAGIVTGGAAAALLTRVAGSFLFGVPLVDLPAIALCGLLLVVVALLAAIGPALRAADVDPASALRSV